MIKEGIHPMLALKSEQGVEGQFCGSSSLRKGGGRGEEGGEFNLPTSLFELIRYAYACGSCRSRK